MVSVADNGLVAEPGLATIVPIGHQTHSVIRAPDGTRWVMDNAGGRVTLRDPRTGRAAGACIQQRVWQGQRLRVSGPSAYGSVRTQNTAPQSNIGVAQNAG